MAEEKEAKVGEKRSRGDDEVEEPETKVVKEEDQKAGGVDDKKGKEKEEVEGANKGSDEDKQKDKDKPPTFSFGGGASTTGGFEGFGGFGSAKPGEGFGRAGSGSVFGGFGGVASSASGGGFSGFGGFANTTSTEGGFPSLSKVFGDTNKPVQLFGKTSSAAAEDGDEETPESVPAETKPVISLQEEAVTTGEEDEECIFTTEGALYEFVTEEGKAPSWKERGRGEMRLNLGKTGGARMIMRAKGNFRLILNAAMWKGQTFTKMEGGKGLTFPCKNAVAGPVSCPLPFLSWLYRVYSDYTSSVKMNMFCRFHITSTRTTTSTC